MKKSSSTRSAFFNRRAILACSLLLGGAVLALFAFGAGPKSISSTARGGGGAPLFKSSGEPTQGTARADATAAYRGPHNDTRPVQPIRTAPLRQMKAIPPALAPVRVEREPIRPKPPTDASAAGRTAQTYAGSPLSAPSAGIIFEGVGTGITGFVVNANPPDTNGRVGATQYVQWNNTSFAVFSKTGTLLFGPAAGNTLFQPLGGVCATHNDGDPVVSYDILSGRWILSQFAIGASPDFSHQCVAVSATGDALGSYYLYDFVTDPANFVDYPKTAVWPDGYYMSGHVFNSSGTAFLAGRIFVFERDKMIQGLPARQLQKDLKQYGNKPQFGFLPSDLDSLTPPPAGAAAFLIGPDPNTTNKLDSTRVQVTWGTNPTITLTETQIAASWDSAPCVNDAAGPRVCVPQPAPATPADYVDNLDFRFMYRLAYRNFGGNPAQESLVANITVTGSASKPKHGAIRWYEFRNSGGATTTPTVFQASTYDPDFAYRWMGSIAMDKDHNMALGYSKSSLSINPGIFINGRLSTDAPNTLGTEATVFAGPGVQLDAGNRWGDYSAMTIDPVDQCTFFYTNEYLPNNGAFNWGTKISTHRFPSCTSAPAWGTVTGTIRSTTGANGNVPLSGVLVTLSNGYAGATNASGVYTILVPPGGYTATAADPDRNCTASTPASTSVVVTSGGTVTRNFTMMGGSNLEANSFAINDSASGNGNSIINSNECVNMNFAIKNNGCARETAISATLSSTTPGVAIIQARSAYPNLAIDANGTNTTPFQIQTSPSFACGAEITFNLDLFYASGHKVITYTVPSCTGGADQTIPSNVLDANDPTQADRLGRDGQPSSCSGKDCPGGGFPGTKRFQTFNFRNDAASPACFTVTINAALGGAGDIESAAYLGTYDPTNLCLNYLGDSGIVGLGTTVPNVSYSFVVPAQSDFVVVVNTTGTITSSSVFSGTVSGFFDFTPGPGPCP